MDLGTVVNPDGVKAQIEGSALWGMSLALFEKAPLEGRRAAGQQLRRLHAAAHERDAGPRHLDHRQQRPAVGLRRAGVTVVAPAIANAIFNACGVRVRSLPITAAAVREGLKAKT
jgi:isoquinoline 1-oxidoreductase